VILRIADHHVRACSPSGAAVNEVFSELVEHRR